MIPATIVEPPFGFVLLQLKECQNVTALPVQNSRCEEEFAAVCVHCLAQGRCLFRLVLLTVDYVHASRALKKVYGDIAHHQFGLYKSFCYTYLYVAFDSLGAGSECQAFYAPFDNLAGSGFTREIFAVLSWWDDSYVLLVSS